jgi:hypothetical protein
MKALIVFVVCLTAAAKTKSTMAPEIANAKTICLIAKLGPVGNGGYAPDLQRAKSQISEAVTKWGRFSFVDDPAKADLIMVVTEGHFGDKAVISAYTSGGYTTGSAQNVAILGDILQVFKGGALPNTDSIALWTHIETGGYSWPAKRAISRFRKDVDGH